MFGPGIAILLLCSLTAPVSAAHHLVYLIGGQSNANGRGDAARLPVPLAAPQKNVRFYCHRTQKTNNVGHLPEDQWTDLAPGSGHGQTFPVYPKEFGPEISFGRACADAHPAAYQENPSNPISRIRADLSGGKPLPFVIGGLSDSQESEVGIPGKGWHTGRRGHPF